MKLTMLGSGHAIVTEYYNTCYVIENDSQYLLVDGGGGSTLLTQLKHAGINHNDIHHIFVTHKHIDHLLGIIWMMRIYCQGMKYGRFKGEAYIYAHEEVIRIIESISRQVLEPSETACIGKTLHLVTVNDGDTYNIIGKDVTFFDIHSKKAKQFGYCMDLGNGEKLTCCGDEPCYESSYQYVDNSKWLFHEAFCLYSQADIYKPYEKNHSTVKDACELAERFHVKNILLYHTEDQTVGTRKELYTKEGQQYYHGNIYVPDDLEVIEL